jgi:hypothetical protein
LTISGKLTAWHVWSRKLTATMMCMAMGAGGFWFLLRAVGRANAGGASLDPFTGLMLLGFFPIMAAISFILIFRTDAWRVIEFTCDDYRVRLRKADGDWQTRALDDVTKVEELRGRGQELRGYTVAFLGRAEFFLPPDLPHAGELADRLREHRHAPIPQPSLLQSFQRWVAGRGVRS